MPALLTARNLPQTLLLTALFLMVAVATALLACGPVAQPEPAGDFALPAAQTSGGSEPTAEPAEPTITPTPHQTPVRTDSRFHGSLDTPLPPPTKKYLKLGPNLHYNVIEFEESQKATVESSEPEAEVIENPTVLVEIALTHNAVEITAWLKGKGVSTIYPHDRPITADDRHIAAEVPLNLIGELSQQEGILKIRLPEPLAPAMLPLPP